MVIELDRVREGWKEGITSLTSKHKPRTFVFVLGTRRTDPNAGPAPEKFEPSSSWLGPDAGFMRVNPILDWTYHDVWFFLTHFGLPYCDLYNRGYTSIGETTNTLPNPALLDDKMTKEPTYLPAYSLQDGALERQGRETAKK